MKIDEQAGKTSRRNYPRLRTIEQREDWAWCRADERFVPLPRKFESQPPETIN